VQCHRHRIAAQVALAGQTSATWIEGQCIQTVTEG
jgi:hypothetical protein